MIHWLFVSRQITRSPQESAVFLACVVLSILTLVSLNGFNQSVTASMLADARLLHGGDVLVQSRQEFSRSLEATVRELEQKGHIKAVRLYEFYTLVRTSKDSDSLLSKVKVAGPGYPLYGRVELLSGRDIAEVLSEGTAIVEQAVLDRLNLTVGHPLRIGQAQLVIGDVILSEPDRPVDFFALGPRVFVSLADTHRLQLVGTASRVEHTLAVRLTKTGELEAVTETLRNASNFQGERIDTYRTASSPVKKFFDNLLFFLHLIGLFVLILAGVGIQSALTSFLTEKETTVGVFRALGALPRFVTLQYVALLVILGSAGSAVGVSAGLALQGYLPRLFEGLIPQDIQIHLSPGTMVEGFALGIVAVGLFTFLPLHQLSDVKPSVILRREEFVEKGRLLSFAILFFLGLLFGFLAYWQLRDKQASAYLVLALAISLGAVASITQGLLAGLKKVRVRSLPLRQAMRGLFRPRNATRAIIVTLSVSLAVILSILTLEKNLRASFIQSYPADAPNLFCLDIQPHQKASFLETLGLPAEVYPIIRARIAAINGKPIDEQQERSRRGDNLTREFNLTYREQLLPDEELLVGTTLFARSHEAVQVSVLDRVAEMMGTRLGDRITFNIQGVQVEAEVVSIRSRTGGPLQPFFYFVFPTEVLQDAPQTIFTAVRVPPEEIATLQNRMVRQFPNVTVIDLTQGLSLLSRILEKLSHITRFFTGFSVTAGLLIIISSTLATRMVRIREAVYFKVLGASQGFVVKTVVLENLILGALSALIALAISQAACWWITRHFFAVSYHPALLLNAPIALGVMLLVVMVGTLSSIPVLRQRPASFLREQSEG